MRLTPDEILGEIIGFVRETNRYPTMRELAARTGVHLMTVKRKISILKEQGKIVTAPRGGSGISLSPPKPKEQPVE